MGGDEISRVSARHDENSLDAYGASRHHGFRRVPAFC